MIVLYLCDRKACTRCIYPMCKHTSDISHAVNFTASSQRNCTLEIEHKDSKENFENLKEIVDDAMQKRDRTVSIYFNPETGLSVNFNPWPDADELYEQYKKGRITANDFRMKMGLPMVKNAESFMKKGFLDQQLHIPKE